MSFVQVNRYQQLTRNTQAACWRREARPQVPTPRAQLICPLLPDCAAARQAQRDAAEPALSPGVVALGAR